MDTLEEKKPWFKTGWGLVLLICFFPFTLTYWLWKQEKWGKRRLIVIATMWIFFFVMAATNGFNPNNTQPASEQTKETTSTSTIPLTTEGQLQAVVNKVFNNSDTVKVNYDKANQTANITYGEGSEFFDEKSMVEGMITMFVETGLKAFKINGVNDLKVTVRTNFTDSYGKTLTDDAASLSMTKDEFQKYNWGGLNFQPIYAQLDRSADVFYIHPAVIKKINLDDLKLRFSEK